jgi:hypothetical protein
MKSVLGEPEWSENYALEAESDVPKMNDGSMYSSGETLLMEHMRGERADDSRFTEVSMKFKEPKDIKRVVLRRLPEDAVPLDVDIEALINGEWNTVKSVRGQVGVDNQVSNDIDLRINAFTDNIKVRVQRATRTEDGKAAITRTPGSSTRGSGRSAEIERVLRQPVTISEIEIYGIKEMPVEGA